MDINVEELLNLLHDRFENNQSKMARVLGIERGQLNSILRNKEKKAGRKIIGAIIRYCDTNELDFHKYFKFF